MGFPYWCYRLHHPQVSFVLANQPGYYPGKLGKNRCFGLLIPILVILTLISSPLLAQRGALTTRQSIDQLTDEATLIVHGHVTSAKVEPHPQLTNLMTVLVTMEVQETLKGTPRKSIQFRQYIWDLRDQLDAAQYTKNQELLLLLGPESQYGLRSPVGLDQGRFRITHDGKDQPVAVNGRANAQLFEATEKRAQARGIKLSSRVTAIARQRTAGPVPLPDLEDAIRSFVRTK